MVSRLVLGKKNSSCRLGIAVAKVLTGEAKFEQQLPLRKGPS
jgi:hypothetical protein